MAPSLRRSGRASKPNQKYNADPFEQYKDLLIESNSEDGSRPDDEEQAKQDYNGREPVHSRRITPISDTAEQTSDDEFGEAQAAEEDAAAAEQDRSDEDSVVGIADDSEGVAEEVDIVEDDDKAENDNETIMVAMKKRKPRSQNPITRSSKNKNDHANYNSLPIFDPMGASAAKGRNVHYTRGIPDHLHNQGRELRVLYSIGVGEEDLIGFIQARDRWFNDVTIPYRKQSKDTGGGGLAYSPYYPALKREYEANDGMAWYHDNGGREAISKSEIYGSPMQDFADEFEQSDDIISGPINATRQLGRLSPFEVVNMSDAFPGAEDNNRAWIMNLGGRIQALDWTPNHASVCQYLAAAIIPSSPSNTTSDVPAAYSTRTSLSPCLQIWEIRAAASYERTGSRIDFNATPRLIQIMSTNWGHIKKMKWCPTPDRPRGEDTQRLRLGLLAAVFEDGRLRVIDVHVENNSVESYQRIHLANVAFEFRAPDSIYTCIAWLSSTSLAAGTADGNVAIWSIADALKAQADNIESQPPPNLHPAFYQQIHLTYIHSISTGYPSRPHILFTYSADGYSRATDLRSPQLDVVYSGRSRITQGPVFWHDISQCLLNCDDNFALRAFSLRTFYRTISVARVSAFAADIAVSHLHASVLIGCVDGTIWVTNPTRRLRDHKLKPSIHCVLKHEWRDAVKKISTPPDLAQADQEMSGSDHDAETANDSRVLYQDKNGILSHPMIRLTTGYQIQEADMGQETRLNATKDFVSFATIYEEKTSATQVAWNPNLRAGTWAAIGMGSGLLIVRDLAAD